jgi:SAM-dependent methyltransferase
LSDRPALHDNLSFIAPLSEARADRLAAWLAEDLDGGTVADAGCGWAELLLRTAQAAPGSTAVGVDLADDLLAEGRRRASERGLADRVRLVAGDAAVHVPERVDALVAIGATQIWGPDVVRGEPLGYAAALRAMRRRLPPHGRLLYGEGIWSQPPTPAATAPLAGRDDEFLFLPELVELAGTSGFEVVEVDEATQEEWDAFEDGFTASLPPDRAATQRASYHQGYRGVLGFAYLQLLAV